MVIFLPPVERAPGATPVFYALTVFPQSVGLVGGWIFGMLGIWPGGGTIGAIIVAFIGAVILVWVTRLLKKA